MQWTTRGLAELVGVPYEEVDYLGAGVNHQAWILQLPPARGRDLYPLLDEAIERDPELRRRVRVEMYRRLGYFPTESSEHSAEYLPWFMRSDEMIERFRVPVDECVRRSEENLREYDAMRRTLAEGGAFEIERSLEYASLIVHSIATGEPRVIYGNVPNNGLISNLPARRLRGGACLVDGNGVQPTAVGNLRPARCTQPHIPERVRAGGAGRARGQGREHVIHAALLDPNTSATLTPDQTVQMVDALIEAHGPALPEGIR